MFDEGRLCEGVVATNPVVINVGHAHHACVDVGIVVDQEHLQAMWVHAPYLHHLIVQAQEDEHTIVQKVEQVQ